MIVILILDTEKLPNYAHTYSEFLLDIEMKDESFK